MNADADVAVAALSEDEYVRSLGEKPGLRRGLRTSGTALLAVAFQGPTAGVILVASTAFAFAGGASFWAIPLVLFFELILAFIWAELVSHYPLAGGLFQWAKHIGGDTLGFFTGISYLGAFVIIMVSVGFVETIVLNGLFPGFAFSNPHVILVTIILVLICAAVASAPVRIMSTVNSIGVVMELFVLFGASVGLFLNAVQPISVIFHSQGAPAGTFIGAFLVAIASVFLILTGSEAAGAFAEETVAARREAGRSIIYACAAVGVFTGVFVLAAILATPDLHAAIKDPAAWITGTLTSALGNTIAKIFLVAAAIAVFSTGIATLGGIVRFLFGMGRDNYLPASRRLSSTWASTGQPVVAVCVGALLSLVPLIFVKKISVIVVASSAWLVLPYILAVAALLSRRRRGWPEKPAPLSLGRFGFPLTVVAFLWVAFIFIDTMWKREATNPDLGPFPILWEFVVGLLVVGAAWWFGYAKAHLSDSRDRLDSADLPTPPPPGGVTQR
jgi:amino acid transporter